MNMILLLLSILPPLILIGYVLYADRKSPEPSRLILKAIFYGFLTIPIALILSIFFELVGFCPTRNETIIDSFGISFWEAAIPEEIAKFIMFWILVRKNIFLMRK